MAGSHEVRGSIPLSSTINLMAGSETNRPFSLLSAQRSARDCDSGTDHAPPSSPWLHTRVNMVSYERDAGGRRSGSEQAIAHGGEDARNRHLVGVSLSLLLLALVAALLALPGAYAPPAFADEDAPEGKRIVRVGYYEDGDYMSYDEAGQLVGYNIDYLEELRRYADWTYEYVDFAGWAEAYDALENGEIDLLPAVYYTQERTDRMLFSAEPMCSIYTTLNVRLDDRRYAYEDFAAFSGMSVGVIENSQDARAFAQYANDNGFDVDMVEYLETDDLLNALDEGALDAIAITYLGSNSRFRTIAQFSPEPIHFAFPLDRAELQQDLTAAMNRLQLRDPGFSTLLYNRYFGINTDQDPVFTEDEYAYLASAPTLRVAYDAFRTPLSYTDPETGAFAGAAARLFEDISRVTGLSFEFVPVDRHSDAFEMVESGAVDLVAGVDRDADEATAGIVSTTGPYLRDPMALIVGPGSSGSRVALPRGFALAAEMERQHVGDEIAYFDTPKQCVDAVLTGAADFAYADTHVANYLLSESQYESLTVTTMTDYTNDMSIGVAGTADTRLLSVLDRCVQYTAESKITTWVSQSSLAVHPTTPLDFLRQYPLQIISGLAALFGVLLAGALYLGRTKLRTARHIEELSFTDPLTGGWTLARFRTGAEDVLERAGSGEHAIVYLDIARFKSFNAAFGYAAGDQLLKALDRLIGELEHDGEHHAHITADEFVVLVRWDGWDAFLERFAELDRRFNSLDVLRSHSHRLFLHAGACIVERPGGSRRLDAQALAELMDCARYARDSVGETSSSKAALYTADMKDRDVAERAVVALARAALDQGEFVAYYQPKVELATNRIVGLEALVRWESPERGVVQPNDFIPLFEKNGFVTEIDLHVLRQACTRLEERLAQGLPVVPIACNFSRLHLQRDGFPERVKAIVDEYAVPVDLIELELTENIVMEDLERAKGICRQLKDLGFRISIDDFGSGYSSLGTLQDLTIDVLKLDRTFLMSSESGERSRVILEGVVCIAEKLRVTIVVEGVETCEQARMLQQLDDAIIAQGYLYSRPVPRAESDRQLDGAVLEPSEG